MILQTMCPFGDPALFQYLSASFVQQLLLEDAWVWSCFVLLFHPERQTRETMVKDMISRALFVDLGETAMENLSDSVLSNCSILALLGDFNIAASVIYSVLV